MSHQTTGNIYCDPDNVKKVLNEVGAVAAVIPVLRRGAHGDTANVAQETRVLCYKSGSQVDLLVRSTVLVDDTRQNELNGRAFDSGKSPSTTMAVVFATG